MPIDNNQRGRRCLTVQVALAWLWALIRFCFFQTYYCFWLPSLYYCVTTASIHIGVITFFSCMLASCFLIAALRYSVPFPQDQIWFHHIGPTKAIVPVRHQLNKCDKLKHGGSTLTHPTCHRQRTNKQRHLPLIMLVSSSRSDSFDSVLGLHNNLCITSSRKTYGPSFEHAANKAARINKVPIKNELIQKTHSCGLECQHL